MDRLSPLLAHFSLTARVFYSGALCGWHDFDASEGVGHVHILRSGSVRASCPGHPTVQVSRPALLFYPRPCTHQIVVDDDQAADVVCASVDFGANGGNPLLLGLPALIVIPLDSAPALAPTLQLVFTEAFDSRCGRQPALDRLTEYLMIQVLRHAMAEHLVDVGALAGLDDPRLSRALTAMHERPGESWTLVALARVAGMSRARFAVRFRQTVGATAMDYLTDWRLSVARRLLRKGMALKRVSNEVGYASPTAFARVFTQRIGEPPSRWIARQAPDPVNPAPEHH